MSSENKVLPTTEPVVYGEIELQNQEPKNVPNESVNSINISRNKNNEFPGSPETVEPIRNEFSNNQIRPISDGPSNGNNKISDEEATKPKDSVVGGAFALANMCFGTTIFCFAIRAKQFGLIWLLIFATLAAAINYWTIIRLVQASKIVNQYNYSKVVKSTFNDCARKYIDFMMMMYAIFVVIDFTSMTYQCIGHFVEVIGYTDKYVDYEDFKDDIWATPKVKYPTVIGVVALIFPLAVIRDLNCLSFTGYFGVGACAFAVLVVVIECNKYYNHYKDTVYDEDDDSTHLNYVNMSDCFTERLFFFKGLTSVFYA